MSASTKRQPKDQMSDFSFGISGIKNLDFLSSNFGAQVETGRGHFLPETSFRDVRPRLHSCERSTAADESELCLDFDPDEQQLWLVEGDITDEEQVFETEELSENKEGSNEVLLLTSLIKQQFLLQSTSQEL